MITLQIAKIEEVGRRLDLYLVDNLNKYSRSHIQIFIRSGHILVNGNKCKTGYSLELNDIIQIEMSNPESNIKELIPEDLKLDILYEDDTIIAINKPAGLVVHPGINASTGTLVHGLIHHFQNLSDVNGILRPGIVHRLDKDTSGVMIVAKTNNAHAHLADQFRSRTIKKEYVGVTWGIWKDDEGKIDQPLARDKKNPTRYAIDDNGKRSFTNYKVKKRLRHSSYVSFYPLTGRTHQIRIHSAYCGHPIFGDKKYGGGSSKARGFLPEFNSLYMKEMDRFNRHALHAQSLDIEHPVSKERIIFEAPLPKEFINLLKSIDPFDEE